MMRTTVFPSGIAVSTLPEPIDYAEAASRAGEGRFFLLVRHGERPPIDPDDPTFGASLPLTPEGEALARACGRALRPAASRPWAFRASPYRRTVLTASFVAEGLGLDSETVVPCDELGIPGIWITDPAAVHDAQVRDTAWVYNDRLAREGVAEGYRPATESTAMLFEWLDRTDFGAPNTFLCTHDCHLACLLNYLGVAHIDGRNWVGYLQGCAIFETAPSVFTAAFIVPDKAAPSCHYEK